MSNALLAGAITIGLMLQLSDPQWFHWLLVPAIGYLIYRSDHKRSDGESTDGWFDGLAMAGLVLLVLSTQKTDPEWFHWLLVPGIFVLAVFSARNGNVKDGGAGGAGGGGGGC